MKNLNISANISICQYNELKEIEKSLVDSAKEAALKAYAPYSRFNVGAAVLLENGEIISGNNQENASFSSGLCAERTALFYANSLYPDQAIESLAVAACVDGKFTEEVITPCGSCRQVILETEIRFKHPIRLILFGEKEIYIIQRVTDIFPLPFGSDNLIS